jgi:hypothetical protein
MVALLALLVVWVVNSGGGGGNNNAGDSDGKNPAPSITPGPSGSGPAISENPGGRDESGGSGDGSGDGEGSGETGSSGGSGGEGGTASSDGATGGGGSGDRVPAGSSLPNCTAGAVKFTVRSVRNTYEPGEKPEFELIAQNTSGTACKVDLGPKEAVLTITLTGSDDAFWTSSDCPEGSGSLLLRVPADGSVTQTVVWDRHASASQCATPAAGSAKAGTYLVEAKASGLGTARTSFVLEND